MRPNAILGPELVQVAERDNSPTNDISIEPRSSRPKGIDFSGLSGSPAFRSPSSDAGAALDGLSPAMGDSWVSVVNTPLLLMFQPEVVDGQEQRHESR